MIIARHILEVLDSTIMRWIMRLLISFSFFGLFIPKHDQLDHMLLSRARTRGRARTGAR